MAFWQSKSIWDSQQSITTLPAASEYLYGQNIYDLFINFCQKSMWNFIGAKIMGNCGFSLWAKGKCFMKNHQLFVCLHFYSPTGTSKPYNQVKKYSLWILAAKMSDISVIGYKKLLITHLFFRGWAVFAFLFLILHWRNTFECYQGDIKRGFGFV